MKFDWINIFGGIIVLLILMPNIIWTIKNKRYGKSKIKIPVYLMLGEQISKYGCMILMVLPVFVRKFGFSSVEFLFVYLGANVILLVCYYMCWMAYSRKKEAVKALVLAIIPTLIFIISGYLLNHWILVAFAMLFGISHGAITVMTHNRCE